MADRWNKAENDAVYRDRAAFGGQQGYAQNAANNYQSLGQAAGQRGAYQNNWQQSDQSRGQQGQAMGLMQGAATGQAPSQAQALGRNMIDQSLNAQMAAAASARGGSLAQAAAMRNAATMGDASRQQGMNQLSALRAQEMAQARDAYFGAASGMRQQDIGQQGMNMQSELAQRQLNQQGQQFYDQLGWNTMRADQEGRMQRSGLDSQEYLAQKAMNQHSTDRETGVIGSIIGGVGSAAASFFSDVTAKTDMQPLSAADADYVAKERGRLDALNISEAAMAKQAAQPGLGAALSQGFGSFGRNMGSLSDPRSKVLMPMSGPAAASFDKAGPGGMDVMGSLKAHSDFGTKFRGDPTGGMMMSDDRAKLREAFEEGAKYADASHAGVELKPPSYVKMRNPAAGPEATPETEAAERAHRERLAAAAQKAAMTAAQPPPIPVVSPPPAGTQAKPLPLAMAVRAVPAMPVPSDERMKVIDLDEGDDRSSMRDGPSDTRAHSFESTFHRDTPADQKRVKRAVEDKAGRDADAMMAGYAAALAKGPATEEAMARANRAMEGTSYAYKPEFTPPEQVPGEKNVGPMAQNLAADPIASTAVKKDPQTGMLVLDGAKMTKLNSSGIASLQRQVDSLAAAVAKRGRS
jgi:hypothetical protein